MCLSVSLYLSMGDRENALPQSPQSMGNRFPEFAERTPMRVWPRSQSSDLETAGKEFQAELANDKELPARESRS